MPRTQKQMSKLKELKFYSLEVKKDCELNGNDPRASSVKHRGKRIIYLANTTHKSLSCVGPKLVLWRIDLSPKQKEIIMYVRNGKRFERKTLDFYFVSLIQKTHQTFLLLGVEFIYFTVL